MRYVACDARSIADALALGPVLLERAHTQGCVYLAASALRGPCVLLGRSQRAGRVIDLAQCDARGVTVTRRPTSGTAGFVASSALHFVLALPSLRALAPDATPPTLLNRNVRGVLRGLTRAGASAQYFGREWLAIAHRPGAIVGFETDRDTGAVLIEILVGYDSPCTLPSALATPCERATSRYAGKAPVALLDVLARPRTIGEIADEIARGIAAHANDSLAPAEPIRGGAAPPAIALADDPVPAGYTVLEPRACAIGWIDRAHTSETGRPRRVWLGGDILAPRWWLDALADDPARIDDSVPLAGARAAELLDAHEQALG